MDFFLIELYFRLDPIREYLPCTPAHHKRFTVICDGQHLSRFFPLSNDNVLALSFGAEGAGFCQMASGKDQVFKFLLFFRFVLEKNVNLDVAPIVNSSGGE